jgi:hypothetical protein
MNKKPFLSWGWGIAIVYGLFLIVTIGSAIYTTTLDYFLVSEDYYQKGIDYQDQIDKVKRTSELVESVSWLYNPNTQVVQFQYPVELSSGKVVFYRPSNSNLDRYVKIEKGVDNQQIINIRNWQKGYWKIKVDWQMKNETFFNEGFIDIK